jgi:uncharacterized protein YggL (DUF469 family)
VSAPCPTLGFEVAFAFATSIDESRRAMVRHAFLETLDAYGLAAEAADGRALAFVITGDGTQATEADRERLLAWLDEQPEIASHRAGPLTDIKERV